MCLGEFVAQAVILPGEFLQAPCFGEGGIRFAATLFRFHSGTLCRRPLFAPGGQVGRIDPFVAQQRTDLSDLRTAVRRDQDAASFAGGELASFRRGCHFGVGRRCAFIWFVIRCVVMVLTYLVL